MLLQSWPKENSPVEENRSIRTSEQVVGSRHPWTEAFHPVTRRHELSTNQHHSLKLATKIRKVEN